MTQIEPASVLPAKTARIRRRVQVRKTHAPFSLRCGALLIDYIVLIAIVAMSSMLARVLGGGSRAAGNTTETVGLVLVVLLAIANFGLLAGVWGQTIGKWATGLRIERTSGQGIGIGRAILRHFIGYPLSMLTLGIGFLIAAVNSRGRTLHDLVADTVVVRDEIVVLE
jgi:uncharacterized RDD family membrane protein YckC